MLWSIGVWVMFSLIAAIFLALVLSYVLPIESWPFVAAVESEATT